MKDLKAKLERFKTKYKMIMPKEYEDFIYSIDKDSYHNKVIKFKDREIVIDRFLTSSNEPEYDILVRYEDSWQAKFGTPDTHEFLTIAVDNGDNGIAIKVLGEDLGKIYYLEYRDNVDVYGIIEDEPISVHIYKLFDSFQEFKDYLDNAPIAGARKYGRIK